MMPASVITWLCCCSLVLSGQVYAQQHKLLAHDGKAGDQFGFSVALDGTTALVGAHQTDVNSLPEAGAAYVFSLGATGWQQQATLFASPANAGDTFGGNVALKNHHAMLGAIKRDDKGEDAGAVFAFSRSAGSWSQQQILTARDGKAGDAFGQSIALTERFMVIGAPHSDAPQQDSGSAYVYVLDSDKWRFHSKLTANDGAEGDLFGISVAIDGTTILVGADLNDERAEKAGAVYVYEFDGIQWQQQAKLMAEDGATADIFGVRVALAGDAALISARRADVGGAGKDAGAAYIFSRSKGQWTQSQKLVAPDGKADDRFARGVALNNDTALISAMQHDVSGNNAGALYVFKKQQGQWRYSSKIVASDAVAEDRFGWNLALSNNTALVAVPHRSDKGAASGAAYVVQITE